MEEAILIVDDESDLVDMLRYNLRMDGYVVHTAMEGTEGLRKARELRPDLIILDVLMPHMDGMEVCRRLRANPDLVHIPILMLTALEGESNEVHALETGADDFISKPVSSRLLRSRVRALLRRAKGTPERALPSVVRVHDLVIDSERFLVERGNEGEGEVERIQLPRKQFQLLHFLAAHAGRAFSRDELLSAVWEDEVQVIPRTVDVHIRRLRQRIGDEMIETVTGVGYRFREA